MQHLRGACGQLAQYPGVSSSAWCNQHQCSVDLCSVHCTAWACAVHGCSAHPRAAVQSRRGPGAPCAGREPSPHPCRLQPASLRYLRPLFSPSLGPAALRSLSPAVGAPDNRGSSAPRSPPPAGPGALGGSDTPARAAGRQRDSERSGTGLGCPSALPQPLLPASEERAGRRASGGGVSPKPRARPLRRPAPPGASAHPPLPIGSTAGGPRPYIKAGSGGSRRG